MPGRDGMELIGYLAAGNYPGKVVVMSGSDPRYIQMSSTIAKTRGRWWRERLRSHLKADCHGSAKKSGDGADQASPVPG